MKKVASAREIMDGAEFIVELPILDKAVRCRKIGNFELVFQGAKGLFTYDFDEDGDKPKPGKPLSKEEVNRLAGKRQKKLEEKRKKMTPEEKRESDKEQFLAARQVVMAAALEPRIVDRDWSEVDREEEIHISLLDEDILFFSFSILHKSGIIDEMPDLPFFRRAVAADDSRDGGELRHTTVGDPEAAAKGTVRKPTSVSQRNRAQKRRGRKTKG